MPAINERLLQAVRRAIPADAACLLRLDGEQLVPLASHGLLPETRDRRFDRRQNPRLDIILRSSEPVLFPSDSPLADPFDGLVAGTPHALDHIHACLGCALTDRGEVVGALTADALEPRAFDNLDRRFLATLGALARAREEALEVVLERARGLVARRHVARQRAQHDAIELGRDRRDDARRPGRALAASSFGVG